MRMHNPPHPGETLKELCLNPLKLSITAVAAHLGISRKSLSELVNGHVGVSPEMAVRLAQAFGGRASTWLALQASYDLWQMRSKKIKVFPMWDGARTEESFA